MCTLLTGGAKECTPKKRWDDFAVVNRYVGRRRKRKRRREEGKGTREIEPPLGSFRVWCIRAPETVATGGKAANQFRDFRRAPTSVSAAWKDLSDAPRLRRHL